MSDTVVCNTGPLIALGGINHLHLLRELFGNVLVPEKVRDEILDGDLARLGSAEFQAARWISTVTPTHPADKLLAASLDAGEATVIAVALERDASLVLLDDAKARRIARDIYGLPVIGTGRLLVEGKRRGFIPSVSPLLKDIRSNGYWISDRLERRILQEANESE